MADSAVPERVAVDPSGVAEAQEALPPEPAEPPDWVADSKIIQDLARYGRTLRQAVNHPWEFSAQWAQGRLEPTNPLNFLSLSVAFVFAFRSFLRWALEVPVQYQSKSFGPFDLFQVATYVTTILLAAYLHRFAFRARRRVRFQLTLGAVMFAIGTIQMVWGPILTTLVALVGGDTLGPFPFSIERSAVLALFNIGVSSAAVSLFVAGARQEKVSRIIGWTISFYALPFAFGLLLIAFGHLLKSLAS
jgi:hypothetical protein